MQCYLGFIGLDTTNIGEALDNVITLPFYGGVSLRFKENRDAVIGSAMKYVNMGDKGVVAVSVVASKKDLLEGTFRNITVLGVVAAPEQAVQRYCRAVNSYMSLKPEYCDVYYPAQMWAGSMECSDTELSYVSLADEWNIDLTPLLRESVSGAIYIITRVPRLVIELRGIDMLGDCWVECASDTLELGDSFSESKILPGYWLTGRYAVSAKVKEVFSKSEG